MKKRYLYSILFGIPGFVVSLLAAFVIFGVMAGFLWIYVHGDNPWPRSAEKMLPVFFTLTFLVLWVASMIAGFITGKRLEDAPGFNRKHILVSAGATALPLALIVLHQFGVGNIGPKSAGRLCSEFCNGKGYPASGMPPKDTGDSTCSCFDGNGKTAITRSLADSEKQGSDPVSR